LVEVIDATNLIAGRLSSTVAKKALEGEKIHIVNAGKAVISGDKINTFKKYKQKRDRGDPGFGPKFPKRADLILRRIIRGMLPYKKERGRNAMRNIKIFIDYPEELKQKAKTIESLDFRKMKVQKRITLKDLSQRLGTKYE